MAAEPPSGARFVTEIDLRRRLPWLLVFRATVASALLCLTIAADFWQWPLRLIAPVLYGVVIGTYVVVFVLGLLLRTDVPALVLSTIHLVTAVLGALVVVGATGGLGSAFSFLYLLAILDAAIIGGRSLAMLIASASSVAYGGQLALQVYKVLPPPSGKAESEGAFTSSAVIHIAAFYLMAFLAGHLAELLQSARREATAALTSLERASGIHQHILEALPLGVLTLDAGGRILTANAACARVLGTTGEELVGALAATHAPFLQNIGGESRVLDVRIGGVRRCLSVAAAAIESPSPEGSGLQVVVIEDRTQLRRLEDELRASEKLAGIGQLAAGIAHELRNPLAAISGAVELMASFDPKSKDGQQLQEIVLREIGRLNRMVEDFLQYARPTPPAPESVDVAALVRDVTTVLHADAAWRGHTLVLDCPDRIPARVDPRQLRQVLWNLLRNAVEASPVDAPVQLVVRQRASAGADAMLEVVVRDRGSGLDPAVRGRLFEPFFTTKRRGTGLGLAVVRRVVEAHGGRVELDNHPEGGAAARVVLPLNMA